MNVQELRESAQYLWDKAYAVENYGAQYSLDEAWGELAKAFEQAKNLVGRHARVVSLNGYQKAWETVLERSGFIKALCDIEQPPPEGIPGNYGS